MTDLPFTPAVVARSRSRLRVGWPVLLYAAVGAAAGGGIVFGRIAASDTAGFEGTLVLLLRFMAAMKLACVVAATLLAHWRLTKPITPKLALGYGAALALMAAAPGLIWSLAFIGPAALLFHAGLITFLVLAWSDDGAVPDRWSRLRARP